MEEGFEPLSRAHSGHGWFDPSRVAISSPNECRAQHNRAALKATAGSSPVVQPSYRRVAAGQCMLLPRMGTSAGGAAAKSAVERCDEPFHIANIASRGYYDSTPFGLGVT